MGKDLKTISLIDIIPSSISGDKNVKAIIKAIDPELQNVSEAIHDVFIISRINELPENIIDLLAWQWHVDFYEPRLPLEVKRNLVKSSIQWHRKKGTKWAVKKALENLGFEPTIKEWFEPEMSGMDPYTFSITGHYKNDPDDIYFLGENTEELLIRAVEKAKPVRSQLINLAVVPIPLDLSDHICNWDKCDWEHIKIKNYDWGMFDISEQIAQEAIFYRDFERNIITPHDTAFYDCNLWGHVPVRLLLVGQCQINDFICELGFDDEYFYIPKINDEEKIFVQQVTSPVIWDGAKWDEQIFDFVEKQPEKQQIKGSVILWDNARWGYGSTYFSRSLGTIYTRTILIPVRISDKQYFENVFCRDFFVNPWIEQTQQPKIASNSIIDIYSALDWTFDKKIFVPFPKNNNKEKTFVSKISPTILDDDNWDYKEPELIEVEEQDPEESSMPWDYSGWDCQMRFEKGNAPFPTWSEFKTWENSDDWETTTEQCMSAEFGTWEEDLMWQ